MHVRCKLVNEPGWSTNELSDLLENFTYNVISYELLCSKEKIHVFYLLILGIFLYSDIELIRGSLFKGDRYNLKMATTVEPS